MKRIHDSLQPGAEDRQLSAPQMNRSTRGETGPRRHASEVASRQRDDVGPIALLTDKRKGGRRGPGARKSRVVGTPPKPPLLLYEGSDGTRWEVHPNWLWYWLVFVAGIVLVAVAVTLNQALSSSSRRANAAALVVALSGAGSIRRFLSWWRDRKSRPPES